PHDEGFLVAWESADAPSAKALRLDLLLEGLPCGQELATGIVVRRYRNPFETLRLLLELFQRHDISPQVAEDLEELHRFGDAEQELISTVRTKQPNRSITAKVREFASGRTLLPYQQQAVGKHLGIQHSADFSVPGSGKTTVALAYWAMARR